jgi:pimeloyl-ACP methyl ester carboxylesterase
LPGPPIPTVAPTVVLVHGAFGDASIWADVVDRLLAERIDVTAFATPLVSLAGDAAQLTAATRAIDGPVVLVGHAYGGAVVSVAAAATENAVALVYVCAFALDAGESCIDVVTRFGGAAVLEALQPSVVQLGDGPPVVQLAVDRDGFPALMAADVPAREAAVAAASQRPIVATAVEEPAPAAGWRTVPSWYVVATADRVVPVAAQRHMARRAQATTVELDGSHRLPRSQPDALATLIAAVARRER